MKDKPMQSQRTERRFGEEALGAPVEFLRLLWEVDHALQTTSKRMARSLGVTGPQRLVVRIVGVFPGISPGELAEILCVHPSTLTGVLKRLTARGVIARRPDAGDRRRMVLSLTPTGRGWDRRTAGTIEIGVRRTLAALTPGDIRAAVRVLKKLAENLAKQSRSWSK